MSGTLQVSTVTDVDVQHLHQHKEQRLSQIVHQQHITQPMPDMQR